MCAARASADGRLPIGDLDQRVGVIKHLVARATQEAALARSLLRHHILKQTLELCPPTWFGLELNDRLDRHVILSSHCA
jgi:hypothetical protein